MTAATGLVAATSGKDLWYLSRGSGLVLLVVLTAVFVLGIVARANWAPRGTQRFVLQGLHRTLSLFAVALLSLHVVTAILDPYVSIGWLATVVPFLSPYKTVWIGLGTLAIDLGGAVLATSLLRRHLGFRSWKAVHWLAYLAWPAAFLHSLKAGGDLSLGWVSAVVWGCAAAVGLAAGVRVLVASRDPGDDRVGRAPRGEVKPAPARPLVGARSASSR